MIFRFLIGFAAALAFTLAVMAAEPSATAPPRQPSPTAFPAVTEPMVVTQDTSCATACQTGHDQCRVATKGSPTCDAERQRCLRACIAAKKK
jgi:hypothetical protein